MESTSFKLLDLGQVKGQQDKQENQVPCLISWITWLECCLVKSYLHHLIFILISHKRESGKNSNIFSQREKMRGLAWRWIQVHKWSRFNTLWRTLFSRGPGTLCALLHKPGMLHQLSPDRQTTVIFRSKQVSALCSDALSTESLSSLCSPEFTSALCQPPRTNLLGYCNLLHIRIFSDWKSLSFSIFK